VFGMKETVLVIAAHNDDQIIGAGGVLAKYAKQGKRIVTIVCSFGVVSHPHLRAEVIKKCRLEECKKADGLLGFAETIYLGLKESKFKDEFKKEAVRERIKDILKKEKPRMIFTHGLDDFHPDHKEVYNFVESIISKNQINCPVFSFDVWSVVKLRKRDLPKMVVNIDDTFGLKMKAILLHESQFSVWMIGMWLLLWKVILKDWLSGKLYGHKYAEVFYRLR